MNPESLSAEANAALVRGDIDGYLARDPLGPGITVEQAAALARGAAK